MKTGARILTPPDPVCIQLNPKNTEAIMTTRQTGGLLCGYKPLLPASA